MGKNQGMRGILGLFESAMITGAAVSFAFLVSADATARPARIEPPPGDKPAEGASPSTGQEAPEDPTKPAALPTPAGKACNGSNGGEVCDAGHPGNAEGKKPNNTPGDGWYQDMARQMYELQQSLDPMIAWSASAAPDVHYFAQWLQSIVQQYYALAYQPSAVPITYSAGRMTRGDYNYYYYYWVQPIYYNMLYYAADYYEAHRSESTIGTYKGYLGNVAKHYHDLTRCNYGFDGDDAGALEDSEAKEAETAAGL